MVQTREGQTVPEDQSGWSLFAGGWRRYSCNLSPLLGELIVSDYLRNPTLTMSVSPLKDFSHERGCCTAAAQTGAKRARWPLDTKKVRAGP